MNIIETGKLLAVIGAVDRRQEAAKAEILAWQELLADVESLDDAMAAVREHRRTSTDWILPAHVLLGVRKIQTARLKALEGAVPNDVDGVDYLDELGSLRREIASGRMDAARYDQYRRSGRSLALGQQAVLAGRRVLRGELA